MKTMTIILAAAALAVLMGAAGAHAQSFTTVVPHGRGYTAYSSDGRVSTFIPSGNSGGGTLHSDNGDTTLVEPIGRGFAIHGPASPAELAPALSAPRGTLGGADANTR